MGAAAIGAGATIYGANRSASAIKDATNAETAANERAIALQAPWREAGVSALKTLTDVAGGDMSAFKASPDYEFRRAEGMRTITGNRAARGLLDSPALGAGLINYGQRAASAEFGSWYNRIANLAGVGQQANNQQTQIAQAQGQNLSSGLQTQGGIQAGLISGLGGVAQGLMQNYTPRPAVTNNPVSYQAPSYIPQNAAPNLTGFSSTVPNFGGLFGATV